MLALTEAQSHDAFAARGLACGEQPDEPTHCWRCEYAFALDDLVDVDGAAMCAPCAAEEVHDDGRPDRLRDFGTTNLVLPALIAACLAVWALVGTFVWAAWT